jgi:hypothetical protein
MQKNNVTSSPDGNSDDFNRWGSSDDPLASRRSRSWPVYAAASQFDYGNDSNAWIAFDGDGDALHDEEHLHVGAEPLPRAKGGSTTAHASPVVWDL